MNCRLGICSALVVILVSPAASAQKKPDAKDMTLLGYNDLRGRSEVDDRGYIYIVDRADTGMHILQLTGEARKIANFAK